MAKSSSSSSSKTASFPPLKPDDYSHSRVHYAVVLADHATLSRIVSTLPRLADPTQIHTESDSLSQERVAEKISAVLDRRDVPHRETPLHLAVRLNDAVSAKILASAGADVLLQNAAGWNSFQEALCRRSSEIALILLKLHHRSAWAKWRRRLPCVVAVPRRMRDFYMEISFHFESSVIPFVGKIAPSDTYKIWKRDWNLRADTLLVGFDGLKIQRAHQSFLFLGDGDRLRSEFWVVEYCGVKFCECFGLRDEGKVSRNLHQYILVKRWSKLWVSILGDPQRRAYICLPVFADNP
ncbi:hypothetical protein ACLB2K_011532 [Fragaria x ananassa]